MRSAIFAGLVAFAASAQLAPTTLERLRGGAAATVPQPQAWPKLSPDWEGDTRDMSIGAAIGFGVGLVVGTAVKASTSAVAFFQAQFAVTLFLHKLGLIEVHPARIMRFVPSCVIRIFDADGDGKVTAMDAFHWGRRASAKADLNKDGKVDERDLEVLFTSNIHAATGTATGFALGMVKATGLA